MWASASKLPLLRVGIGQTFFNNYRENGYMLDIYFLSLCKLQELSKQAVVTKSCSVHVKV